MNDGVLKLSKSEKYRLLVVHSFRIRGHHEPRSEYPHVEANFERHLGRPRPRAAASRNTVPEAGYRRHGRASPSVYPETSRSPQEIRKSPHSCYGQILI